MQVMPVGSLGQEGPLEKEMATQCNILTWGIPWTEVPGGLQSMGSQESDTTEWLNHHHHHHHMFLPHFAHPFFQLERPTSPLPVGKGLLSSGSLNALSHWSLPPLNFTVSVMVVTAHRLLWLLLSLYLYVNEAKVTSPYQPVVYKMRFIAYPSRLFQLFLEYLVSQICPGPVPHSFLFCSPWGLFPKNHKGEVPYGWALWFSPGAPKSRNLVVPKGTVRPSASPCSKQRFGDDLSSNPESEFILWAPEQFYVGLKSHKDLPKAGSLASVSWAPLS